LILNPILNWCCSYLVVKAAKLRTHSRTELWYRAVCGCEEWILCGWCLLQRVEYLWTTPAVRVICVLISSPSVVSVSVSVRQTTTKTAHAAVRSIRHPSTQWLRRSVVKHGVRVSQVKPSNCFRHLELLVLPSIFDSCHSSWWCETYRVIQQQFWESVIISCWPAFCCVLIDWLTNHRIIDDYNDMPTEYVISLEYLTYFIVLHCVLAAFCQLLLNVYCICIVLYWMKECDIWGVKT